MAADLQIAQVYTDPTIVFGSDYVVIQPFFQYHFPSRHLSPQTWGLQETLSDTQKDDLYKRMLTAVSMTDHDIIFTTPLMQEMKKNLPAIQAMQLSDSTFTCDRRKGFSTINNATKNRAAEHKLTALSRRLRDSFAHGRIGLIGDYILLEDSTEKSITARFILKIDDLKLWKDTIEQYLTEKGIAVI